MKGLQREAGMVEGRFELGSLILRIASILVPFHCLFKLLPNEFMKDRIMLILLAQELL